MPECPICKAELTETFSGGDTKGLSVCASCFNPLLTEWRDGEEHAELVPGAQDMRRVAPPGSIASAFLTQVVQGVQELPILPEVSQRILKLLNDPEFEMSQLTEMIREDPVIALAIMKQANSAAFGGLHEITDLGAACSRLGMRTIANTVQLVANRSLFITGNTGLKNSMSRLWRHSIASAHCANEVARISLAPDPEAIFLAGLVHDIGKVLLLEMIASPKDKIIQDLQRNPDLMRELIAGLHAHIGLVICQAWEMPPLFRAAVYFHHNPAQCPVKEWLGAVHTVCLANTLATMEGYGMYDATKEVYLASHPSTLYLSLSDIKLATLRVDLADTLEALFEVAG